MSSARQNILALSEALEAHLAITHWAVSMRIARKGDFIRRLLRRLRRGGDVQTQTYERVLGRFAEMWPVDLEWPEGVPRPDVAREATERPS